MHYLQLTIYDAMGLKIKNYVGKAKGKGYMGYFRYSEGDAIKGASAKAIQNAVSEIRDQMRGDIGTINNSLLSTGPIDNTNLYFALAAHPNWKDWVSFARYAGSRSADALAYWNVIDAQNNAAGYQLYIDVYPDSKHTREAEIRLAEHIIESNIELEEKKTVVAKLGELMAEPTAALARRDLVRLEELFFKVATEAAIEKELFDKVATEAAIEKEIIGIARFPFEPYLTSFPQGVHRGEIEETCYLWTTPGDDARADEWYCQWFPQGKYFAEVQPRVIQRAIEREEKIDSLIADLSSIGYSKLARAGEIAIELASYGIEASRAVPAIMAAFPKSPQVAVDIWATENEGGVMRMDHYQGKVSAAAYALHTITGAFPGPDYDDWAKWWRKNKEEWQ